MLSIITVLSISFYDINCNNAVFYLIKPWLVVSPVQHLVVHKIAIVSNLFINILFFLFVYLALLYKVKQIKMAYLLSVALLAILSIFHLSFFIYLNGHYRLFDGENIVALDTQISRQEPEKIAQIAFWFNFKRLDENQCQDFRFD